MGQSKFLSRKWIGIVALYAMLGVIVSGCDSSSDGGNPPATTSTLSGTVATGAPVAGVVHVIDRNGNRNKATIGADGRYALSVSDMTAPFLIMAVPVSGDPLFSFANAANIKANITPLTNLSLFLAHNQGDLSALFEVRYSG